MIYILYIVMFLSLVLLFMLIKDKVKLLKIISITTSISGILLIIIGYMIKILIHSKIKFINISIISSLIFNNFLVKGLLMILIGLLTVILYKVIIIKKRRYT